MKTQANNSKRNYIIFLISVFIITSLCVIGCSSDDVTAREGAVQGKIVTLSGTAIKDALVTWEYDNTRWGITDEKGNYYIDGVGFGDQVFVAEANGYRNQRFTAPVYSGRTTTVNNVTLQAKSFSYSNINVVKTTATSVTISWTTSDYTNGVVEFGLTEALGSYAREQEGVYNTKHSLEVTNLNPEKLYYFRISSNREGQSIESSSISTFSTVSSYEDGTAPNPPTNVEAAASTLAGQSVVFWNPCYEADLKGYKIYRCEVANGNYTQVTNGFVGRGQERFTDSTVVPGKKYFYHVTAVDQAGNESGYNNVAEILVPGNITSEVHWTVANSPYILTGDINISEFGLLYIDGGVEVKIAETDQTRSGADPESVEFNVRGALIASAGNYLPVKISSIVSNPNKASWKGICFERVSNVSNTMVNFEISDAETAITVKNSAGVFSDIKVLNCYTGMSINDCKNIEIRRIETKRCTTGLTLNNNTSIKVSDSSFVHPANCIISKDNNSLTIEGSNMLEYTNTGITSEESSGNIEFINNLFVSPSATALVINGRCQKIENCTFDSPYAIQLRSATPIIAKNLFMADRSIFGEGKKCIEFLGQTTLDVEFGPNNVEGFPDGTAYLGCQASIDSTSTSDIILIKDVSQATYDYRLNQPYPSGNEQWGIFREEIPYQE